MPELAWNNYIFKKFKLRTPSKLFCAHFFVALYNFPPALQFSFLAHKSTTSLVHEMETKKHLTAEQRIKACSLMQAASTNGKLHHGVLKKISSDFSVTRQTMALLWQKFNGTEKKPLNTFPLNIKRQPGSGRLPKYDIEELRAEVVKLPLMQRKTIRDLAYSLKIPPSTMHRIVRDPDNGFRRHTSSLKPFLKESNKLERVLYAVSKIHGETYQDMEDEVHVDEKWFFLTRVNESYLLLDCEDDPQRSVGHKSHIDKIMFLAATAKPRWDPHKKEMWDGKIGIWPFARREPAKRNSIHRAKGTLEWKSFKVDREAYRNMLVNNVLPAIVEKWPQGTKRGLIRIQQDNAPLHIKADDALFLAAVATSGLNVQMYNQPPNSPDTNINDLAFFRSIQTLQHKIGAGSNKDSLVESVYAAFNEYPWWKLRNAFLTLQCCLNSIIECNGGNDYKIVHMSKEKLEREGLLPTNIIVTDEAESWIQLQHDDNNDNDDEHDDNNSNNMDNEI